MSSCRARIPKFDTSSTRPDASPPAWGAQPPRTMRRQVRDEGVAALTGIVPEPDLFNIFILNYTMKCPLACDYCCYGCSPKRTETMDVRLALDLVDQAADLGVFGQCGFTGGEPLIFYDDILAISERMHERRLPFSMISSCYWAKTRQEADRVIGDLARHGMAVFTATHDASHETWVPQASIAHAVEAALEAGVHVCICASFYDDTQRLEALFPQFVGHPEVDFVNRVVLPDVGRTLRKTITPSDYPNVHKPEGWGSCYKRIYHDLTVFWDGEAYPCCSVYNRSTAGLSLGNLYREPLAAIWDRLEGSLLYRTLKGRGFEELYGLLSRLDPDLASRLPDPEEAVGPCHLCHTVFKDRQLSGRIFDVVAEHERGEISRLLHLVRTTSGHEAERAVIAAALSAERLHGAGGEIGHA